MNTYEYELNEVADAIEIAVKDAPIKMAIGAFASVLCAFLSGVGRDERDAALAHAAKLSDIVRELLDATAPLPEDQA